MEIAGRIILELPERGGVSARSGAEWKLKTFVLETMEQYPKKMTFEVFGSERIASMNIQVGEVYTISFDIDAHEYQGRWYNSIRAWRAVPGDAAAANAAPVQPAQTPAPAAPAPAPAPTAKDMPFEGSDSSSDLPF